MEAPIYVSLLLIIMRKFKDALITFVVTNNKKATNIRNSYALTGSTDALRLTLIIF